MSTTSGAFLKWIGGIAATVISGVVIFALTNQPAPARDDVTTSRPETSESAIVSRSIDFSITDQLGEGQISERISVFVDGRSVGTLTVDVVHANASLVVTLPEAGTYSYRLEGSIVVADPYGNPVALTGQGEGEIVVSNGRAFALAVDYTSDPAWLTLT